MLGYKILCSFRLCWRHVSFFCRGMGEFGELSINIRFKIQCVLGCTFLYFCAFKNVSVLYCSFYFRLLVLVKWGFFMQER